MAKKWGAIVIVMIVFSHQLWSKNQFLDGYHYTGIEYLHSDLDGVRSSSLEDYSLVLAEGKYNFINYPTDFEGMLKYNIRGDSHQMLDAIGYKSVGGRYQYNGFGKNGVILGVKGALDYDNFYEVYDDYFSRLIIEEEYPRKSGKTKDEDNFGLKFYGDVFDKVGEHFTYGLWNDFVIGKEESEDPVPIVTDEGVIIISPEDLGTFENTTFSITISPKIIYQNQLRDNMKFVFEGYVENRRYFKETFQADGEEQDTYYKVVLNPQLIMQGKIGEEWNYYKYSVIENERFQYVDYWQHTFKTNPSIRYAKDRLRFGFLGGGYDFEDEIGIVFDNKELFAVKKSDSYVSWIIAPKIYLEYEVLESIYLGYESVYRKGEWDSEDEGQYLEELTNIFYVKYEKYIKENLILIAKTSYEIYDYKTDIPKEKRLPEEDVTRVSLGVKAVF